MKYYLQILKFVNLYMFWDSQDYTDYFYSPKALWYTLNKTVIEGDKSCLQE